MGLYAIKPKEDILITFKRDDSHYLGYVLQRSSRKPYRYTLELFPVPAHGLYYLLTGDVTVQDLRKLVPTADYIKYTGEGYEFPLQGDTFSILDVDAPMNLIYGLLPNIYERDHYHVKKQAIRERR